MCVYKISLVFTLFFSSHHSSFITAVASPQTHNLATEPRGTVLLSSGEVIKLPNLHGLLFLFRLIDFSHVFKGETKATFQK